MSRRALLALVLAACGGSEAGDKPEICELAPARQAVEAQDRKILGVASAYPADATLVARDDELAGSIAARRAMAWQVVERVLEPVSIAEPTIPASAGLTLPRFRTWYAKDDLDRMFKKLYGDLGPEQRRARAPFDPAALDGIEAWNAQALDELPTWTPERYADYVAGIDSPAELEGVGGTGRVGYDGEVSLALLSGYARELSCTSGELPPAVGGADSIVARGSVTSCESKLYGPYTAGGGTLSAHLVGDDDVDLYMKAGAPPTVADYDCRSRGRGGDETCSLPADGPVYVLVLGYAEKASYSLTLSHEGAGTPISFAPCLDAEAPPAAAVVKQLWKRADFGGTIPVYDTSAARLAGRFASTSEWGPGDGLAAPGPDDIYTVTLSGGETYRMPALHIMTKELRHWVWITLWWSSTPDDDFGADRPATITGPFSHYKMCVVTSYDERDPDPRGGQPGSLGDSLAAVHDEQSWCSNPYLEEGPGNAQTNCVGCHQHAGTKLRSEDIIGDELLFPARGRAQIRDNFPTDYLWSAVTGDDLVTMIRAEVDFWDSIDP